MRCHWWNRWWHRRMRQADRELMLPALRQAVRVAQDKTGTLTELWTAFKAQPGQEHWYCECAATEIMERLRTSLRDGDEEYQ